MKPSNEIDALTKEVEQKNTLLEETKHYFEYILARVPGCVYWLDTNNIYLGCNNTLSDLLGLSSNQEIIGKTNNDLPWKEHASDLDAFNNKVMSSKKAHKEEEVVNIQGKKRVYISEKVPIFDKSQKVVGLVGISIDITEQKRLEEDLKKAKEAAEMASFYKTEFIANMSHDIRTPLSGVVGRGEQLEKEIENPNHRNIVHNMVRSTYALLDMLNEMLDVVSTGNTGIENIHEEPFDLPHLVQTIIDLEQSLADLKKIELLTSIDEKLPTILLGDHKKLHHIVSNLVGNAIKFTKQGHVAINIKLLEKNNNAVQVLFEIADTGIGISPENLGKVFELFYKITPSHKGLHKGYGIGLHIFKLILMGNI